MARLTTEETSIEARFEGHPIIEQGTAAIPNLLLRHYVHLGLSDGHFALLVHVIGCKWTAAAPFPKLRNLAMSVSYDTRRSYVRDMRRRGLLFTKRLYWTNADVGVFSRANPGRVRSNLWFLGSLLHNLVRVDEWLESGQPLEEFFVEIPLETVRMALAGEFHDVPAVITMRIEQVAGGEAEAQAVGLPCENRTVDLPCEKLPVAFHTDIKKNHDPKKNHEREDGDSEMNAIDENELPGELDPLEGLGQGVDGHQRKVDETSAGGAEDPVEVVARHHYAGFMEAPVPLPAGKRDRKKWIEAARRLLHRLPAGWDVRKVCEAVDRWWTQTPERDAFWTKMPCKDETLDLLARFYLSYTQREDMAEVVMPTPRTQPNPDEELWKQVKEELRSRRPKGEFETTIRPTRVVGRENGTLIVAVRNDRDRWWLGERLRPMVDQAVANVEEGLQVEFRVEV